MTLLRRLLEPSNRVILTNAGSLVLTTGLTSGLGFVYWWLAARLFPTEAVGLAAALISAMSLLGTISMLGLGTFLIGELPRRPGAVGSLLSSAALVAGLTGVCLGLSFALLAPGLSPELAPPASSGIFAIGVGLAAVCLVVDQATIGLLRGELQLLRNTIFSVAKLLALGSAGLLLPALHGLTVFATGVAGMVVSLIVLAVVGLARGQERRDYRPSFGLLRRIGPTALSHHALNVSLQAPGLALPILVSVLLSTTTTAYFFTAWMVAGFVFVGSVSLTTTLYAIGARDPAALARRLRFTLALSLVGSVLVAAGLFVTAEPLLSLFGAAYATEAASSLRVLALGAVPLILKNHYVAICRVHSRIGPAALWASSGACLELALAAIGGARMGLPGFAIGWLVATCIEVLPMTPLVYRTALGASQPAVTRRSVAPAIATAPGGTK